MKKILVILIIAIIFYLASNFVLSIFLPEKINKAAKEFVEENFGRKINISYISVNILRGIYLKDATIFEEDKKTPYLKVKTIRVSPFYPSLFSNKKLFLSVNLEGVYFTLKRNADDTFNLLQVKTPQEATAKKPSEETKTAKDIFLVKSLTLKKVNLDFVDTKTSFKKSFNGISAFADLQNYPKITSKISWQDKIVINAKYNQSLKEIRASVLLKEIKLTEFNCYFPQITLKNADLKNARINIGGNTGYFIKVDADINNVAVVKEKAQVQGDIHTVMQFNSSKEGLNYNITGSLKNGSLEFPPYLENLSSLEGNFTLDKSKMRLTNLTAVFLAPDKQKDKETPAIPITATAEVNFETSQVTIGAKTSPKIEDLILALKTIPADSLKNLKKISYEGNGDIELNAEIKTNLKNDYFEYYIDYDIKGVKYKELENIRAKGFIAKDRLEVEEYALKHKGVAWRGKFTLNDFASPDIQFSAKSLLFDLTLSAKQLKDLFAVKTLTIKTKNSQITAEGGYHKDEQKLELQGLSYIELSEIAPILDTYQIKTTALKKADPKGVLNAKFMITGPLSPDKWQIKFAGLGEKVKIYNIEARDAKVELYRDKDLLIISPLVANVADGKIDLRTKIDSVNKKVVINVLTNDINLAVLREELKLKNSSLSGILSMDVNLENSSLTSFDKMEGSGKISIHNGNIWEINFLKGMGEFLFIPEFEEIKFQEGYSDLTFKGENVVFENIELKSLEMTLTGKGRISLKGDLNFILISEFNSDLVAASQGLKKFFTNILGQASLAIELKGTIKHPVYDVKPVIFSDLQGFKKILDDIFK